MITDKSTSKYCIDSDSTIDEAASKIAAHQGHVIFSVDENGVVEGVVTNGDIIRWVAGNRITDVSQKISDIANKNFRYIRSSDSREKLQALLEDVLFVPVLDDQGRILAVARARQQNEGLDIGGRLISTEKPTFIIAEIGNNHNGSLTLAREMIDLASEAGVDCIKFQLRDLEELYVNKGDTNDASENLGSQYTLDLVSKFQLGDQELFDAMDYCTEKGVVPLCTPWDISSSQKLEEYGVLAYKVASADLTNHDLINFIGETGKPLLCSTGMSSEGEIKETIDFMRERGMQYALLHCNSTYPPPLKDINLRYMERLRHLGQCVVGYSGHERGITIAIAAVAMGARIIEKHFTLDRKMEGNDHRISLLPAEMSALVTGTRQIEESLGAGRSRSLSQGEIMNRATLSKSVFATKDINKGEFIEPGMLVVRSPGQGLPPNQKRHLIGKVAPRNVKKGSPFHLSDINEQVSTARVFNFGRKWGIPVRYHDYAALMKLSNPQLLEFHLSYKDLEIQIRDYLEQQPDLDLIVHAPELFKGDHTLDLCSTDSSYRATSIDHLQQVVEVSRTLGAYFANSTDIGIVTNIGGFTDEAHASEDQRQEMMGLLLDSLNQIDQQSVSIWPQTMPPYPWHFGGRRYHNMFVESSQIAEFCTLSGMKVCLDISHSKLACTRNSYSFQKFLEEVGPFTAHLHIADASGTDGEGLQIGEGELDFVWLCGELEKHMPEASMIPEVWQGHENDGAGFWQALDRLEKAFDKSIG